MTDKEFVMKEVKLDLAKITENARKRAEEEEMYALRIVLDSMNRGYLESIRRDKGIPQ